MFGDRGISRHQARTRIDHKQHDVRLFNRQQRLFSHTGFNAIFCAIDTAGIDTDKFTTFNFSTTVLTVTSQPGKSATNASRVRVKRLKSVDFPTLGRPTSATTGIMLNASYKLLCNIDLTTFLKSQNGPCLPGAVSQFALYPLSLSERAAVRCREETQEPRVSRHD
jgi:hypothetical protein